REARLEERSRRRVQRLARGPQHVVYDRGDVVDGTIADGGALEPGAALAPRALRARAARRHVIAAVTLSPQQPGADRRERRGSDLALCQRAVTHRGLTVAPEAPCPVERHAIPALRGRQTTPGARAHRGRAAVRHSHHPASRERHGHQGGHMVPRVKAIVDGLRDERARLERFARALGEEGLTRLVPGSAWSVKGVITHVATLDAAYLGWFTVLAGDADPGNHRGSPRFDVDHFNESAVAEFRGRSVNDILGEGAKRRARLVAVIERFSDDAL